MTILLRELRFTTRRWRRAPVTFLVALSSFTVGIAACIATLTVFDAILLRPLPFRDAANLVKVVSQKRDAVFSLAVWEQFRDHQAILDSVAAIAPERLELATNGESRPVEGLFVSGNLLKVLGVETVIGRGLTPHDDRLGSAPVCMIGYAFWQREYGGRAHVLGQSLVIDDRAFEIVGVTTPEFFGVEVGRHSDILLPVASTPARVSSQRVPSTTPWLHIIGRMRAGETAATTAAGLRAWQPALRAAAGDGVSTNLREPLTVTRFDRGLSTLRSEFGRPALTMLVAAASALFLIACGNVVALKIAALLDEQPEFAIRRAIGASRPQLFLAGLIDVLVLALLGLAAGTLLAMWAIQITIPLLTTPLDRGLTPYLSIPADGRLVSLVAFLFVASAAAMACLSGTVVIRIQERVNRGLVALRANTVSGRLVMVVLVLQVGFAAALLATAGLLIRSFIELTGQPTAINDEKVVLASLGRLRFASEPAETYARIEAILDDVRSTSGVQAVSASTLTPLSGIIMLHRLEVPGVPTPDLRDLNTSVNRVTPEFFTVFGTQILVGRGFTPQDDPSGHRVAVVNTAFADYYLQGANPVGRLIKLNDEQVEVVGVVATGKYMTLREPTMRFVYVPLAQWISSRPQPVRIAARGGEDAPVRAAILETVRRHDVRMTVEFRTLRDEISVGSNRERLLAVAATSFGTLALFVTAAGLYGSFSYSVIRRTREFAVRAAVGASPQDLLQLVWTRAGVLIGSGALLGTFGLLAGGRFIRSELFGVEPHDLLSLVGTISLIVAVGAAATYLPARRASKLQPATSLRDS